VADGLKIDGNMIRRHGVAGPAIKVRPHSGGIPTPAGHRRIARPAMEGEQFSK
jgi:hypothetical protein